MRQPIDDGREGLTRSLVAGGVVTVAAFLALGSSVFLVDANCGGATDSWRCGSLGLLAGAGVVLLTIGLTAVALRASLVPCPLAVAALALLSVPALLVSSDGAVPGLPVLPLVFGTGWAYALRPERRRRTPLVVGAVLVLVVAVGLLSGRG